MTGTRVLAHLQPYLGTQLEQTQGWAEIDLGLGRCIWVRAQLGVQVRIDCGLRVRTGVKVMWEGGLMEIKNEVSFVI